MLRSLRTRFFGHGLGFLVSIAWPFVHILLLLLISYLVHRTAPYGDSMLAFFSSGIVPFICWSYTARYIMTTVIHGRPMLAFPVVKLVDLLMAGAILEVLSSCVVLIALGLTLEACGADMWPADPVEAAYAFGISLLLGMGCGMLFGLLILPVPMMGTVQGLLFILVYIGSGIYFLPSALPETLRYYLSFNPVLQAVEWMRTAYYDGYASVLDRTYVVSYSVIQIFAALAIERLFRGRFLMMR